MNLLLFTPAEIAAPLLRTDPRAVHILTVLRRQIGDTLDVGLIDGPRGKATLTAITPDALALAFTWQTPPPPLAPLTLLIGLPRPQTARKILQEATALGVGALHFFTSERGEASYAQSTLWSSGEWRRHLITGAEQAFCTRLPLVTWARPLAECVAALPPASAAPGRLALDNYEAAEPLGQCRVLSDVFAGNAVRDTTPHTPPSSLAAATVTFPAVTLAFGSERGWSARERDFLRAQHFTLVHLGPRVLRAETAVTAAIAITKSRLGLM